MPTRPDSSFRTARSLRTAAAALVAALVMVAPRLAAQRGSATIPMWRATPTIQLESPRLELRRIGALTVSPTGEIIIIGGAWAWQNVRAFDSTGGRALWMLSTRGDDTELRQPERMGWHGATLWIADPGFDHVALVTSAGRVTRSIEQPSWIRPPRTMRRDYPVFGDASVLAYRPDRSMLVRPFAPNSLLGAQDYDANRDYIVRVNESGIIQHTVARIARPAGAEHVVKDGRGRERRLPVPLVARPAWSVAESGDRVAVVTSHIAGRDSGFYHVAMLGVTGDTVYARRYPFRAIRVTARMRDSIVVRAVRSIEGGPSIETLRADVARVMPGVVPPIDAIHLGRDHTLWIGLHAPPGQKLRRWVALDARGTPVGQVDLDRRQDILLADRGMLWVNTRVTDNPEAGSERIVRLTLSRP